MIGKRSRAEFPHDANARRSCQSRPFPNPPSPKSARRMLQSMSHPKLPPSRIPPPSPPPNLSHGKTTRPKSPVTDSAPKSNSPTTLAAQRHRRHRQPRRFQEIANIGSRSPYAKRHWPTLPAGNLQPFVTVAESLQLPGFRRNVQCGRIPFVTMEMVEISLPIPRFGTGGFSGCELEAFDCVTEKPTRITAKKRLYVFGQKANTS